MQMSPDQANELTPEAAKGDSGKTFPLTWSSEDSGNEDQEILTVAILNLGRREFDTLPLSKNNKKE
jgi:hypothetical protein